MFLEVGHRIVNELVVQEVDPTPPEIKAASFKELLRNHPASQEEMTELDDSLEGFPTKLKFFKNN